MDKVSIKRLQRAIDDFGSSSVLVVGDVMLDHYIHGDCERISPEAPVPVVKVEGDVYQLGGAANVAHNIASLGGRVGLSGLIGKDATGGIFLRLLSQASIEWFGVEEPGLPTIQKVRILARGQQLLRMDRESPSQVAATMIPHLKDILRSLKDEFACVVVSDYAKGAVSGALMDEVRGFSREKGVPTIVDPKPANLRLYKGVHLITPNKREAEAMARGLGLEEFELSAMMGVIKKALDLDALVVTMGESGMAVLEGDEGEPYSLPTMAREVFDVTGAGDTVVALLGLGLSCGLNLKEAAFLANIGAGLVVGKVGTATLTKGELLEGVKRAFEYA